MTWKHYPETAPNKDTAFVMVNDIGCSMAYRDKLGRYHTTMNFPAEFHWTTAPTGFQHSFKSFDKK